MNMRTITLAVGITTLAATASSFGQVVLRGTESSDQSAGNSASSSAVTVNTGDRDVVPLIKESKETKVDANTQRTESVTRARLGDGSYFEWQRSTTVSKDISPGQSVSSTDLVEKDRQGQSRVSQHSDVTVSKSASGETGQTKVYKRDSSGQLVLDHVVDANTVKGADGAANTTSVEKTADVNGNLSLLKQVDSVAVNHGPNEQVITAETKTLNHLNGQLAVAAEETTSITTQGGTKQSDSVVRTPGPSGWEVTSRTTTTETKAPDGSVSRETILDARPVYSPKTGNEVAEPLVPQTKIVEHEVHHSDGTTILQRDVFHRDVNGDWKPESFSMKEADKGL
ncbi:MAG: hypothetical protein ACLP0A_02990 [Verrucomicrobiia bacterium]